MIKTLLRFSIVLLGLFFLPFFVKAQSCVTSSRNYWEWPAHNNWYIGTYPATWTEQAHIINFSAGFSVTTRGNGTIANAMYSYEGITTASDDKGNLIVFSNGIKAWNNAGVQTSSTIGEGTEGVGTVGSASQGIISVRHPLDPNKYYFIATADVLGPELKTTYNVFDQTGTQVQGNTNLPGNIAANEGITATMHQNGVDIWVVVAQKSSTNIQAWLLTCEGFVNNPVTSPVGVSFSSDAARGGIALSHDGKKLASLFGGSGVQQISMYDFNNGTGVVSNRQDVGPCCSFARGYDVVFSKDNSGLVVGSWGVQGAFYFNIASKTVTTITGPDAQHHAVEIGADGIYYFKVKDGLWTWTGSGAATKVGGAVGNASGQGLPTMYMPPVEEPDIKEVGPFCTTDPVIDLSTTWICSRVNSEDTLNWVAPSAQYSGVGITNTTRGFFNPATAGPGLHKIIFKKCAVDDTITIEVKNCSSCNVILKNTKPEICVGQSIKLDSLVLANNGTGVWKIDSVPLTSGISATLSNGATDTLFNTTEASKTGTYKLMLTNTYMGTICKDSIYIVVNLKPDVTVNSTAICPGASATFTATTTATSPSYLWKFNGTVITGATSATTTGSVAGNYTVQIIDNKTCKDTATGVLKINALPVITVRDTAICSGDAAVSFKAISDTTASSYLWTENSTVTTQTATGKTAGNYTVKVTDKNGCIASKTAVLTVNSKPDVTVNKAAICPGASATFTATTTATSPSYLWKFNGTAIVGSTASSATGSVAGNYTVEIIDNKSCKDTATGVLKINALPVITVRDTAICSGDAAVSFKATSDSTAASYLWTENSTVTTQTATGKTAGNYTVKVTDKNGCIASKTAVLTVNTKPDVTVNSTAICQGASATFTATTSATSPTYLWIFNGTAITGGTTATTTGAVAGSYTVQIIDNKSCKDTASGVLKINALHVITVRDTAICSGDAAVSFKAISDTTASSYLWTENSTVTTQTATGKTAGNYTVKVTDKNGCIASKTAVLTVNSKPDVTVNKAAICPGASATFTATTTATSPSYLWKFNGTAIVGSTASSATGSVAGNYTVEIIDNKSCKDTATGVLKINALPVITVRDTAICSGDAAVSFKATSDSTAASYLWSENSTVTTQTATGKTAGNYTVKVTDKNGCIASKTAVLTVNTKPDVTVNNAAICPGATATFTATTTATSPSYLWKYNGTAVTGGNTATTTGTVAGNYTVQIIDNKTCKDTATGVLTLNSIPTPDVIADVTICPGMSQTFDVVSFNNGNGPFTYKWKDGTTGSSINVGTAGTYYVDITDKNGCVGRDQAVLGINSNLNVKIAGAPTINICEGETAVLKSNYNKVDGYNFSWKPGNETTETISVTTAGKYDLHVDNGLGCQGDGTVNVVVNLKPIVADGTASICSGESATIGNNVGAGNTYVWKSLTDTTYQVTVTTGGTYERVVTTSANCKDSSEYVVTENANPIVTINDVTKCEGENVTLSDPSLSTGYNYSWSNGATSASISPTTSGSHTLSVTNSSTGCKGSDQATVTFISIPVVDLGPDTIPICDGEQAIVDAGNAGLTITWSNGATTPAITMTTTGLYSVTVTNGTCPTIDQVYLDVQAVPVSGLNKLLEDERFCFESLENGVTLSAGTNNSYTYLWNTGDRTADLIIEEPGMYTVEISVGNCAIADQITISEFCPYSIFVPNAVSPNGDGVNDIFYAKGHHIIDYQMTIFDRWGLEIYTVKDMEKGWDCKYKGNLVQIDVYVWKISYTYETVDGAIKEGNQVGTVTVVE